MAGKKNYVKIPIDHTRFMKVGRTTATYRPVCERVRDYNDVTIQKSFEESQNQASRCMDCGVPFCHWGCPVGNYIPEWNKAMQAGEWEKAYDILSETNNFPEFTGRICPAPCEHSCVLGINDDAVTIRENELAIIEYAFKHNLIKTHKAVKRTGKTVAIIGSGPAGLATADQLNKAGHTVTIIERDKKPGGLLRYGIPDFKLDKEIVERRINLMKEQGIKFITNVNIKSKKDVYAIKRRYDAIVLTGGARVPRDLDIPGRDLSGIHFAMDYLSQSNKRVNGERILKRDVITAKDKNVVIIGGGDTGSDCIGTANRQGAACVVQIELLEKPSNCRTDEYPWPKYPLILKTTSSHQEGSDRHWTVMTKAFKGEDGHVKRIECVRIEFSTSSENACPVMKKIKNSEFIIDADLVVLAIGFVHPEHEGIIKHLQLDLDQRGNVATNSQYMTSKKGIFSAGDMRRGQSLIVWAINEGRNTAHHVDVYLSKDSKLPIMR